MSNRTTVCLTCLAGLTIAASAASAQYGYGVNGNGILFRFELQNPNGPAVTIGNVGFVPEGIDFRPGSPDLYAIDVGPNTSQLYKIDITTGAATPVGSGFNSSGGNVGAPNYDLGRGQTYGFDFNPTTLQPDDSMRIRLVASGGSNIRINSGTGAVSNIDGQLSYGGVPTPGVDAIAYTNSAAPSAGGSTSLFVMDYTNNQLALQDPPNNGTLTAIGSFGATINNTLANVSFDILSDANTGANFGYAVLQRPDTPVNGPLGAYLLYNVNLSTGAITGGALVDSASPRDFTGGFAVSPFIPAPGATSFAAVILATISTRRRRAR